MTRPSLSHPLKFFLIHFPQSTGLVAKLAAELRRKLKLMSECENKEDRDIIGQEIFNDVTGPFSFSRRHSAFDILRSPRKLAYD